MAYIKFYYKLSQIAAILAVFLLISESSWARPLNNGVLAGENIVLVTGDNLVHQFPTRERVNLLLHRLPKGKKPVSGPSKRNNSLND
ncbi:hypothetical protein RND71_018797 [Anisodus tanguticus]|uniref:Uncharacterized protein n=1 Tax=Anisodus tanguticus TaxID=243964 RepID=A0AAE1S4Y8_9SOLA|nr:hypothetical protein RND71_018797 [Anisodus tanguticus]